MRDEKQEKTAIRCIESNSVKAHLCAAPEESPIGSAQFRDEHRQLVIPEERRPPARQRIATPETRRPGYFVSVR
jgi:hypothetical protein